MNVNEVAKLIGTSPLTVRIGLQQGVFPFGVAFKRADDNKRWTYIIYENKVREYIGERNEDK